MNALLAFTSALSDPVRLRLIALAYAHKVTPSDLASVLKLTQADVAAQLKQLTDTGLLKADAKTGCVRVKGKHRDLIEVLFTHFALAAKTDATLKSDAKHAKQLRDAKRTTEKDARKQKTKPEKKPETKPGKKPKTGQVA